MGSDPEQQVPSQNFWLGVVSHCNATTGKACLELLSSQGMDHYLKRNTLLRSAAFTLFNASNFCDKTNFAVP
jgi:hypothetical protein